MLVEKWVRRALSERCNRRPASIVGHNICSARDIVNTLEITMVSMMQCQKAEQACMGNSGGGGTFLLPCDSHSVVRTTGRSELGNGVVLGEDVLVGNGAWQGAQGHCL